MGDLCWCHCMRHMPLFVYLVFWNGVRNLPWPGRLRWEPGGLVGLSLPYSWVCRQKPLIHFWQLICWSTLGLLYYSWKEGASPER